MSILDSPSFLQDTKGFIERGTAQSPNSLPVDIPVPSYDGPWQIMPSDPSVAVTANIGLQMTELNIDEDTHLRSGVTAGGNNYGAAPTLVTTKDATDYVALLRASTLISGTHWPDLVAATLEMTTITNTALTEAELGLYWIRATNGAWIPGAGNNVAAVTGEPSWNFRAAPSTAWVGSAGLSTPDVDFDSRLLGSTWVHRSIYDKKWFIPIDIELLKSILITETVNSGFLLKAINARNATWTSYVSSFNSASAPARPKLRLFKATDITDSGSTVYKNHITPATYAMEFRVRGNGARFAHGAQAGTDGAPLENGDIIPISEGGDYRLNIWRDVDTQVFFRPRRRDSWTGIR
jgi:hypothetical protein